MVTLTLSLLAAPPAAEAQPPGKVYRIGYLSAVSAPGPRDAAFLEALRDLGYVNRRGQ